MPSSDGRIDLRCDTVTTPTPEMRRAMADAEVGDDVYGEDPTVNRLESLAADLLGKEAALFTPSGTMANQLAIRVLAPSGHRAAVPRARARVPLRSRGGGVERGRADAAAARPGGSSVADAIAARSTGCAHCPPISLLTLENTHMPAVGRPWTVDEVAGGGDGRARRTALPVHVDGARIWNAVDRARRIAVRARRAAPTP